MCWVYLGIIYNSIFFSQWWATSLPLHEWASLFGRRNCYHLFAYFFWCFQYLISRILTDTLFDTEKHCLCCCYSTHSSHLSQKPEIVGLHVSGNVGELSGNIFVCQGNFYTIIKLDSAELYDYLYKMIFAIILKLFLHSNCISSQNCMVNRYLVRMQMFDWHL